MKDKKTIWNQGTISSTQVLSDICSDVANDILVTVGNDGTIFRKTITNEWTQCRSGFGRNDHIYGVAANFSSTFVAGGRFGFIVQSADNGVSWATKRPKDQSGAITKIAFGNDLFLAILDKGQSPGSILCSTDGVTWTDAQAGIPNATSIKFLNGSFFIGAKNGAIYYGSGASSWNKCNWEKSSYQFQAARALAYNPDTGTYFAAGHQVAISQDNQGGETWKTVLDLTKNPTWGQRNIQAIVPVGNMTYLFGEDLLILKYDGFDFTQVGDLGKGGTLGALLYSDRIICVGTYGDRYVLLEDLNTIG